MNGIQSNVNRPEVQRRLEKSLGAKIRARNIYSITVNPASHQMPKMKIEVGRSYKNLEPEAKSEKVLAIFESTTFLVCTQKRGLENGLPYFFARGDVVRVEEYPDKTIDKSSSDSK